MGKMIEIANDDIKFPAYYDEAEKDAPAILVIHEVWALNNHTKDIADRFHKQGYTVLAPDLLEGTEVEKALKPDSMEAYFNPEERNKRQTEFRAIFSPLGSPEFAARTLAKLQQAFGFLENKNPNRKIAVVGFCFGGSYAFSLAAHQPKLAAAVPFYGHCDLSDEEIANIKSPILAFYGENDQGLVKDLPSLIEKMKEVGKSFEAHVYPNTAHAFFNDTNLVAYNKEASEKAWSLTLAFLKENL